jgi:hypothetical protein
MQQELNQSRFGHLASMDAHTEIVKEFIHCKEFMDIPPLIADPYHGSNTFGNRAVV